MAWWNRNSKDKKAPEEMSSSTRARKLILSLSFKAVMLFMGIIAIGYGAYSVISGSSIFIPQNAQAVLDSSDTPNLYSWNAQIIREVRLPGQLDSSPPIEQQSVRGATLDTDKNKFQAEVIGALPSRVIYNSDGNYTLRLFRGGTNWEIITDACNDAPAISTSTIAMPSPDQLKEADPEIISDQSTFFGERAWSLSFKPNPEIMQQLFWTDFFEQAVPAGILSEWVMSKTEKEEIANGDFEVEDATMLVQYKKPREVKQIDVVFKTKQSRYRVLAQVVPIGDGNNISNKDLQSPPQCPDKFK